MTAGMRPSSFVKSIGSVPKQKPRRLPGGVQLLFDRKFDGLSHAERHRPVGTGHRMVPVMMVLRTEHLC
jgi:hypothetical protein